MNVAARSRDARLRSGTRCDEPTLCQMWNRSARQIVRERRPIRRAPAAWVFACGTSPFATEQPRPASRSRLTDVAKSRTDLDADARRRHRLFAPLQLEHHAIRAGAEDVFDREPALDLALARFVRRAVGRRFRLRSVAPVPFDGRTVEFLGVVRSTDELRCRSFRSSFLGRDTASRSSANRDG